MILIAALVAAYLLIGYVAVGVFLYFDAKWNIGDGEFNPDIQLSEMRGFQIMGTLLWPMAVPIWVGQAYLDHRGRVRSKGLTRRVIERRLRKDGLL